MALSTGGRGALGPIRPQAFRRQKMLDADVHSTDLATA
jgi:hypothetical protein